MNGVRYREDTGWEGRCDECKTYWPLDSDAREFWYPARGVRRCRACHSERDRGTHYSRHKGYKRTPEAYARHLARDRKRKAVLRADPKTRDHLLERQRETQRRYYERHKAEVLKRHRDQYVERVGHLPKPGIGRPRVAA